MSNTHFNTSSAEPDPRRWVALAILLLASFMNLIDVTIVNVALPAMQANLNANSSQIEWVVAAYILFFALLLLPSGRLGDIVGVRSYAVDPDRAQALWAKSEQWVGESFPTAWT